MTHVISYHIPIPMYVQIPVLVAFSALYLWGELRESRRRKHG